MSRNAGAHVSGVLAGAHLVGALEGFQDCERGATERPSDEETIPRMGGTQYERVDLVVSVPYARYVNFAYHIYRKMQH